MDAPRRLLTPAGGILLSCRRKSGYKKKWITKKTSDKSDVLICMRQTALSTLPERRHLVQTLTWHGDPFTRAFTRLTLGFQVLFDLLWEWETLMPKTTPLPQISHLAILLHLL